MATKAETVWDAAMAWGNLHRRDVKKAAPVALDEIQATYGRAMDRCQGQDNGRYLFIWTDHLFECGGDWGRQMLSYTKCSTLAASGGLLFEVDRADGVVRPLLVCGRRKEGAA